MSVVRLLADLLEQGLQVWAEGGNLRWRGAAAPELRRQLGEEKQALLSLLRQGKHAAASYAQQRLWFIEQVAPDGLYNVPLAYRLRGPLRADALGRSLTAVVRRHEALRTTFTVVGDLPVQVVAPPRPRELSLLDLSRLPEPARDAEARRLAENEARTPFDLVRGPLLRALLVRLAAQDHLLLLALHHLVTDGWSLDVLLRELCAFYPGAAGGAALDLPAPLAYADFAAWQRQRVRTGALDPQLAYWRERLDGMPAALDLPSDRPRPPIPSARGGRVPFALAAELLAALREVSRGERATLFMALLAGCQALLARLSGQDDVAVGTPMAGRELSEFEGVVGLFVNMVVLRTRLTDRLSGRELLQRARGTVLEALQHQEAPFDLVVELVGSERTLSRQPLVQVAVTYERNAAEELRLGAATMTPLDFGVVLPKFDLTVSFTEDDAVAAGAINYSADLWLPSTMRRLGEHLVGLLRGIAEMPDTPVGELPILGRAERHQLLCEWNDTEARFAEELLVHQLFERRAERVPEAVAVVCGRESLTYAELERRANQLAHLLASLGAGPGVQVAVWMDRSLDLAVAVLGTLKAGAIYLPIEAGWPLDRVEAILEGVPVALTRRATQPRAIELQCRLPALRHLVCLDARGRAPELEPLDPDSVRALWDHVDTAVDRVTAAGSYSHYAGEPFSEAEVDEYRDHVAGLVAPHLTPCSRVLEIGCGSGLLLWELAPRVAHYVALDPSERTQQRNRARAEASGLTGLVIETGFAHEIDRYPEGSFDLVLMASVVQSFPGPVYLERVVAQALRLLAPGGVLLVADVLDARRRGELRQSVAGAAEHRGQAAESARDGGQLYVDPGFFRHLFPGAVEVVHRARGFGNELRFRYDVLLTRGESVSPATGDVARRWWTGWHLERSPAHRPAATASPDDVAYVIHTSGSTGIPKGIAVQHRPAVNLIGWINDALDAGPGDRLLFVTSICFDLSVYDLLGTLAAGGCVDVAIEEELRDPERLARHLLGEAITLWDSAPAALQQLVPLLPASPGGAPAHPLRWVLLSGDWIPVTLPERVRATFVAARVLSLGGATEATVWSNWFRVDAVDPAWASIPYGRPIANARYHVLDRALAPCPIGVPGELFIGGACLCLGYPRQPEATARQFVPDPFGRAPGARLYRTGDRARYGPDGNLEFLGRLDQQVKVRGFRIELEEIEGALQRHPKVRAAAAAVRRGREGGGETLAAYVVPEPGESPTLAELRAALQETLPEYMVPWTFVVVRELPVTANGKLDRQALPDPAESEGGGREFVAPRNSREKALAAIWSRVLGIDRVGAFDSFFELGGHSLLVMQVISQVKEVFDLELPIALFYRSATVAELAEFIQRSVKAPLLEAGALLGRAGEAERRIAVPLQPEGTRAPLFCVHATGGHLVEYRPLAAALARWDLPVFGLQASGLDGGEVLSRLENQAARYVEEVRAIQPHGPYQLAGYCSGGVVAFEMARQLRHADEEVALLAVIEGDAPPLDRRPSPFGPEMEGTAAVLFAQELKIKIDAVLARSGELDVAGLEDYVWCELCRQSPADAERLGEAWFRRLYRIYRANLQADRGYVIGPYDGQVTLFEAALSQGTASSEASWCAVSGQPVARHELPGSHYTVMREPYVAALAERLSLAGSCARPADRVA